MSWLKTLGRQGNKTITILHPSGEEETWNDDYLISLKYDLGDQIWLTFEAGEYKVIRARTYNGLELI